jgi:hypothetical protein
MSSTLPNSHGILSTSPKSTGTFSLYAESSSTRRGSVPSINDSPSFQRRMIDSTLSQAVELSKNFVPPRM